MVPFDRDMWPFLWKAPLLLLLVGLLMTACSSTPSVPERPPCPPVSEWSKEKQQRLADRLRLEPSRSIWWDVTRELGNFRAACR